MSSNVHYSGLLSHSQRLRKEMTKEERHLWYDFLKLQSFTVHRQKVFGHYIVDFYIASVKIVIELDGSQHYTDENRQRDQERDVFLQSLGLQVLRYSNADINQRFNAVCEDILHHARTSLPLSFAKRLSFFPSIPHHSHKGEQHANQRYHPL